MATNVRLFLSLPPEDLERLDVLREELGMRRSQFVRYLLSGQKKSIVPSVKYVELNKHMTEIDTSLRVIALKEELHESDKLQIYAAIEDIKRLLGKAESIGPVDQRTR